MKVENICIYNMYPAVTSIRHSFKSTDKSDSHPVTLSVRFRQNEDFYDDLFDFYEIVHLPDVSQYKEIICQSFNHCILGIKDRQLVKTLMQVNRNSERKFLRQILVSMDITTSIKHWAQLDTYKISTVRNSESTMHSIVKGELTQVDFDRPIHEGHLEYLNKLIKAHNEELADKRTIFELLDSNLPAGYKIKSHWTGNYANLRDMYADRKNHKMWYWREFCRKLEDLPYFSIMIGNRESE